MESDGLWSSVSPFRGWYKSDHPDLMESDGLWSSVSPFRGWYKSDHPDLMETDDLLIVGFALNANGTTKSTV